MKELLHVFRNISRKLHGIPCNGVQKRQFPGMHALAV